MNKKWLLFLIVVLMIPQCTFAKKLKEEPLAKTPLPEYAATDEQATLLYAQNDIEKSFQALLTIPDDARTAQNWLLLGNILHDKGKNDDAIFMYNEAVQTDINYYKGYYNLGVLYLEQNKPNMAVSQFQTVIKLKKDYAYAHYNLACAYIQLGNLKMARRELLSAIALNKNVPEFHYNLAYVYKQLKNDKNAKIYLGFYDKLESEQ
ncbi:MAG: tetratricopeptide repeat protein [Clostridiaceae bacterium]|jgi:tetratricopeptide (TPR) repeat protein|nr:tetratricopeptide repeat protein [Clostridiaceae bacterium]